MINKSLSLIRPGVKVSQRLEMYNDVVTIMPAIKEASFKKLYILSTFDSHLLMPILLIILEFLKEIETK